MDLTKLSDDRVKAMIYDEQGRTLVAQNNIKALQQELLRRTEQPKAVNMVEDVPCVPATAVETPCCDKKEPEEKPGTPEPAPEAKKEG